MSRLIRLLRAFEGTIVCFNSFMAHLCHYLGKPALVIHKDGVPYGYDCSVIHRQVVLDSGDGWSPRAVLQALGVKSGDLEKDSESRYAPSDSAPAKGLPAR